MVTSKELNLTFQKVGNDFRLDLVEKKKEIEDILAACPERRLPRTG